MELNERIRSIRKGAGLTQEQFGDMIGVGKMAITYYEGGKRTPQPSTLKLIANKFHVNEVWLISGEGEMYVELSPSEEATARLGKVQAQALSGSEEARFKERMASAILAMDDTGCQVMMRLLEDMGYVKK